MTSTAPVYIQASTAGRRFQLILLKPSHYDDDGYVIRWWRAMIPSNSLAALYGIAADCAEREVLGPDVAIDIKVIDETNSLVRQVPRGQRNDVFRSRESSLEPYLEWLDAQWAAGKWNGTELWRRLKTRGFRGSCRVVSEWATRRKRADKADANAESLTRIPSARTIARPGTGLEIAFAAHHAGPCVSVVSQFM